MRRFIPVFVVLLLASCSRDEFGSRDSGSAIDQTEGGGISSGNSDDNLGGTPNSAEGDDSSGVDGPVLGAPNGDDYESAAPSGLAAVEAVTRATFTEASASTANLVFSPLSLTNTLVVTGLGGDSTTADAVRSRTAQQDLDELASSVAGLIRAAQTSGASGSFTMLPTMWIDEGTQIEPDFVEQVVPDLIRDVRFADFSSSSVARQTINNFYKTQTEGRISNAVGPLGLEAASGAALVDTVYLDAAWEVPFSTNLTQSGIFRGDGGDVSVAIMQRDGDFLAQHAPDYEAIVVPYASLYDLVIVIPTTDARHRIESQFSVQFVDEVVYESVQEYLRLKLPKVVVEGRVETALYGDAVASSVRRAGGLSAAGLATSASLVQRAVIAFDEASTMAVVPNDDLETSAGSAAQQTFEVDRPFLFAVRERTTGMLLFVGRVNRI